MTEPTSLREDDDPRDHRSKRGSSAIRSLVLVGALVAIVAGGLWDHYGARLPREQAYGAIQTLQGGTGEGVAQAAVTQDQVRQAIGRAPNREWVEEGVSYELYSWRRGMPIWTYDLYAAYAGDESMQLLVANMDEQPPAAMYGDLMKRRRPAGDDAAVEPATDGALSESDAPAGPPAGGDFMETPPTTADATSADPPAAEPESP